MVSVNKDPKEGVEYITGADGVKRPMAYYKAAEERARIEIDWPPESPDNQYHLNK